MKPQPASDPTKLPTTRAGLKNRRLSFWGFISIMLLPYTTGKERVPTLDEAIEGVFRWEELLRQSGFVAGGVTSDIFR